MEKKENFVIIESEKSAKPQDFEIHSRNYFGLISSMLIYNSSLLLTGNGNILNVYNYTQSKMSLIFSKQIFFSNKITKIKSFITHSKKLLIFVGETELKYSLVDSSIDSDTTNFLDFDLISVIQDKHPHTHKNFINDLILKSYNNVTYLILGFIGNFIEIFRYSDHIDNGNFEYTGSRIFCPEKCIIYSMCIYNDEERGLIISSGTVFRDIILWQVSFPELQSISTFKLSGHRGAVFNLYFGDRDNLISVSDDRTVKHWIIDYSNKTFKSVKDFIGHSARVWDAKVNLKKRLLVSVGEDCNVIVWNLQTGEFKEFKNIHLGKNIRCLEMNEYSDDFFFTAGEDWQIFKWNLNKLLTSESYSINSYSLSCTDQQFKIAKLKQKNFTPAIKVIKFVSVSTVLIGTNHGNVILYRTDTKKDEIIFSDIYTRVINTIDHIEKLNITLVGLSDGKIVILDHKKYYNFIIKEIYNNIRLPFIHHKFIEENLIITFSNPLGHCKIFYVDQNNPSILDDMDFENNCLNINTGIRKPAPITSCEIVKLNEPHKNFLLMLGDFEGNFYFTLLSVISNKLYRFNDIRCIKIHSDKITEIKYFGENINTSHRMNYIYTCSRDGKFKKLVCFKRLNIKTRYNYYTIEESDCKYRNDILSLESFHFCNDSDEKGYKRLIMAGHNARNFIIYDYAKNSIFHTNDIKGNNRPFDIKYEMTNKSFIYAYSEAKIMNLAQVELNDDDSNMIVYGYNTPLHGRLIHTIKFLTFENPLDISFKPKFCVIVTGSEDTYINFYEVFTTPTINLKYLEQFSKHSGAIRKIELVKKKVICTGESENVYSFILVSVAACSECFLFMLEILVKDSQINKINISFLYDLSVKQMNLDTRNMSVHSVSINKSLDMLIYCNTICNAEVFIFDFNNDSAILSKAISLKLENTKFVPLCVNSARNNSSNNSLGRILFFGLTNGILYLKILYNIQEEVYLNYPNLIDCITNNHFKIHEAGINDIKIKDEEIPIIITCGEDNSIIISTLINFVKLEKVKVIRTAHSSPVKSISFLFNEFIVSGGYDQRLSIIRINSEKTKTFTKINSCVSEINCVDVGFINDHQLILAAGQGIEIFKL